jgi:hypothetical protein
MDRFGIKAHGHTLDFRQSGDRGNMIRHDVTTGLFVSVELLFVDSAGAK